MNKTLSSLYDKISPFEGRYKAEEFPKISIIIPTYNCASLISITLEGILNQDYPSYEIIIVDCSTDRTLEIVRSFHSDKIHILSVEQCNRYEMLNKGLSQAHGVYVSFLFPGDFYLHYQALKHMMTLALENHFPPILYAGTLIRNGKSEAKILFREFSCELLKRGQQPTTLQSCIFRTDTLRAIGKFNTKYKKKGGFELMCRYSLKKDFQFVAVNRVLMDYDLRLVTRGMTIVHFWETMKIIKKSFGFPAMLAWLFHQKDFSRIMKSWWHRIKIAFLRQ